MRKRILFYLAVMLLSFAVSCSSEKKAKPRIGIAGIAIECSTFSPARTTEDMFRVSKKEDVYKLYPFLAQDSILRQSADWFPAMMASATPGGVVTREAYNSLVGQILEQLKVNLPYDGLYLDIHGAMSVEGMDDPEGDFLKQVRDLVGNETMISTSMDPHGCVTQDLLGKVDIITSYRQSPHEDRIITKRRAISNLVDRLENGKGKPLYKAWVYIPILLPGEKTSTRVEPGKSLCARLQPITEQEGVTDASIWISYAWADAPRNHAAVVVVGDDQKAVGESAESIAKDFWNARSRFEFVAPTATLEECLADALKNTDKYPYFISDMGDNPTAGGAGDVTWTLDKLLKRKEFAKEGKGTVLVYASIPGPELVEKAIAAGVGKKVSGVAGAMVDDRYSGPVKVEGKVEGIKVYDNNKAVVIRDGNIKVIVTEKRLPFHYERSFTDLGIDVKNSDIVVVKLGYLTEELYAMRNGWMMAHTRGGVDQELVKLPYKRINRPMYPLDPDMAEPALKAVFVPVCE